MGRKWRKYSVDRYSLGQLNGQAVVRWRDERGPHRERLGVFGEDQGRKALDAWVAALGALRNRGDITFKMIWDEYYADRKKDGKQMEAFDESWRALEPRFGSMLITDITNDICRDYAKQRMERGRSYTRKGKDGVTETVTVPVKVGTVWTELLRLRSCVNWAWGQNKLKSLGLDDKPKIWVPKKPESDQRALSVGEFVAFRDACLCTPHLRLFVILALTTAARTEAILQLQWSKVDFEAGTIDFREAKGVVDPLSKRARKGRALALMTPEARAALIEADKGALTDYVIEWDEEPVKSVRKAFAAAVKRSRLDGRITPHTLRHTALTWLEEEGIALEMISKLAAHSGTEITRKTYLHASPEVLRPAAEAIERRLQLPPPRA
jgi:integrase